jgi:hypothetical protein
MRKKEKHNDGPISLSLSIFSIIIAIKKAKVKK